MGAPRSLSVVAISFVFMAEAAVFASSSASCTTSVAFCEDVFFFFFSVVVGVEGAGTGGKAGGFGFDGFHG